MIGGVVLCGGKSRRMGQPKAWLPFEGEPMLVHVIERLRGQLGEDSPLVAVAAVDQELPALPRGVVLVRDAEPGQGPLRGIATGLLALPEAVEFGYVCGTDGPLLQPGWVDLLASRGGAADVVFPEAQGYHHPLAALYRRATVPRIALALLAAGRNRPVFLLEGLRGAVVPEAELRGVDPELLSLRNINTPEDYDWAVARTDCKHEGDQAGGGGNQGDEQRKNN